MTYRRPNALLGVAIGCLLSVVDARLGAIRAYGQQRTAKEFEVASVRTNDSNSTPMSVMTTPGRFTATSIDLRNLITVAYRLPWFRIIGVPGARAGAASAVGRVDRFLTASRIRGYRVTLKLDCILVIYVKVAGSHEAFDHEAMDQPPMATPI